MINHVVTLAIALAAIALAQSATAQRVPRTFPVARFEQTCLRVNVDPRGCARASLIARQRYGADVTLLQWNSAIGVVRHMRRQGKPI